MIRSRSDERIARRESLGNVETVFEGAPFGLHPTHLRIDGAEVTVARRASDLAGASARVDVDRLAALLTVTSTPSPLTSLFEGVVRVPPDSIVKIDPRGQVRLEPRTRSLTELSIKPLDAAAEIWRLFVNSVARCVGRSKHVAVLAGGGVDSSAVLAAALAISRGAKRAEVDAIALHFAGEGDDRPYMHELERSFGIVAVKVVPADAASSVLSFLESSSLPGWSWSLPTDFALLRAARERGADVALTGAGGDDLFDGLPRALAHDVAHGDFGSAVIAARLRPSDVSTLERVFDYVVRPTVGRSLPAPMRVARRRDVFRRWMPWAGPALRAYLAEESKRWRLRPLDTPSERFDSFAKATYLADAIEITEEVASRAGIRVAHPFLDMPLVELVSRLPPRLLFHAYRRRGLFRLAIRGHVPDRVRLRLTKAKFLAAWRETLRAAGGRSILDTLGTAKECERHGLVDAAKFQAAFQNFDRDDATWTDLWPVLGFEGFLRARAALGRA